MYAQAVSLPYCDPTSICYSSWTSTTGISLRIVLPSSVTDPYDAIVKLVAPKTVGWVGFASGGHNFQSSDGWMGERKRRHSVLPDGVTGYTGSDNSRLVLNGTGTTKFALVQGPKTPKEPANNVSTFGVHQSMI